MKDSIKDIIDANNKWQKAKNITFRYPGFHRSQLRELIINQNKYVLKSVI